MFMYMCHRAAGAVWISERCRTGQRWWGSEVTHFPLIKRRWEWMWADRRREDGTRRGGSATRPAAQKKKNQGQRFAAAEGRNTRTRRLKRLTTAIPVLTHPLNQMARTGFSRSYVLILERKQVHPPIKVVICRRLSLDRKWG